MLISNAAVGTYPVNHLIVLHKHCSSFLKNGLQDSMTWQWEKIIADSNTLKDENTEGYGTAFFPE